jgi:hypothetical protein
MCPVFNIVFTHQVCHFLVQGRRKHGQAATGSQQEICFAPGHRASANDQGALAFYLEENGQMVQ